MDFQAHRQHIKNQISQMEEVLNDKDTPSDVKKFLRTGIAGAKQQLVQLDADEAAASKPAAAKSSKAKKSPLDKVKKITTKKSGPSKKQTISAIEQINAFFKSSPAVKKKYKNKQIDLKIDAGIKAKSPGKRISASGKTYYENRANRSDIHRKNFPFLQRGGTIHQTPPQNPDYDWRRDKGESAKPVGYRYTQAGAQRLGVSENAVPTAAHIEKYKDRTFIHKGEKHRYLYSETRRDKSDRSRRAPRLESGGTILPHYFGTGENISVFGYQTTTFDICGKAVEQFRHAIDEIESEYKGEGEDVYYNSLSTALRDLAESVDQIFTFEKMIVSTNSEIGPNDIATLVKQLVLIGAMNYKSGLRVDLSFMDEHLITIIEYYDDTLTFALGGSIVEPGDVMDFRFDINSDNFQPPIMAKGGELDGKTINIKISDKSFEIENTTNYNAAQFNIIRAVMRDYWPHKGIDDTKAFVKKQLEDRIHFTGDATKEKKEKVISLLALDILAQVAGTKRVFNF